MCADGLSTARNDASRGDRRSGDILHLRCSRSMATRGPVVRVSGRINVVSRSRRGPNAGPWTSAAEIAQIGRKVHSENPGACRLSFAYRKKNDTRPDFGSAQKRDALYLKGFSKRTTGLEPATFGLGNARLQG